MSVKYKLKNATPIASGGEKLVFWHPESDTLLIKVWRDRYLHKIREKHSFLCRYLRTPRYSGVLNEVVEHIAVRENNAGTAFLQNIYGFADTDLGLGLVVEAVKREDGKLADSLHDIVSRGNFESIHREALSEMTQWLAGTHVVVRDLTLRNVVWAPASGRFIIIDGIGSRPVPSLRLFSKSYNCYTMKKKIDKLYIRLDKALIK